MGYQPQYLPKISFNYLGQFNSNPKSLNSIQTWNLVEESSGRSVHSDNEGHYIIDINGMVIDGKLKFEVVSRIGMHKTNQLAKLFKQNLKQIIDSAMQSEIFFESSKQIITEYAREIVQ